MSPDNRPPGMQITSHIVTTPPRDAATVVLLRDGDGGLEVFLMKRAAQSDVLGGAYVFRSWLHASAPLEEALRPPAAV